MNKKNYNSGEFHVGKESGNRFVSSSFINDTTKSSVAIIISIVALIIIACTFFAVCGDFTLPAWNPLKTTEKNPDDDTPSKPVYLAAEGGKGMYQLDLSSDYAILVRLSDMSTVAHKYADELIYPASMTKVMTVIVALDLIENLDDIYTFHPDVLSSLGGDESTADMKYLYVEYGSVKYTVRDLLYGISYRSGADSVVCLLDYLGLDMTQFAALMNKKAEEIGLQNTNFGGAIGMDSENNTTTCRDIAAIMAYAMGNPLCVELFGGRAYRLDHIEMTYYNSTLSKTLTNMGTTPEKVLGLDYTLLAVKSGLEDKAGYCLVSYIRNDVTNEYFILVTAGADRAEDYPFNKAPILDMELIFDAFEP